LEVGSFDSSITFARSLFTIFQTTPPRVMLYGSFLSFTCSSVRGKSVPNSENPADKITPTTFERLCSMLIG
jgi:hypothetical protein